MKRVYICHPFSADPKGNAEKCRQICERITKTTDYFLPIAPQVYLPQFMDDGEQRKQAMRYCLSLLEACEELWIIGNTISEGMRMEIEISSRNRSQITKCYATVDELIADITPSDIPF